MDFWISGWISGFQSGFLDFRLDFRRRCTRFHSWRTPHGLLLSFMSTYDEFWCIGTLVNLYWIPYPSLGRTVELAKQAAVVSKYNSHAKPARTVDVKALHMSSEIGHSHSFTHRMRLSPATLVSFPDQWVWYLAWEQDFVFTTDSDHRVLWMAFVLKSRWVP